MLRRLCIILFLLGLTCAALPALAQEEDQVEQVPLPAPNSAINPAGATQQLPPGQIAAPKPAEVKPVEPAAEKTAEQPAEKPENKTAAPADASNPETPKADDAGKEPPKAAAVVTPNGNPPPDAELPPLTEMPKAEMENMQIGVLRTIDKLSARTHTFELPVDKTVKFGTSLYIKLRACRKSSPIAQPDSAAFLQIWERKPHEDESHWVFSGWMFSSSPSLSAMDHPVYDVWLIECKNAATSEKSENFSAETAPEKDPAKDAASKPAPKSPADDKSPAKQGGDEKPGNDPAKEPPADSESSE